jgi:hypothetical protein
VDAGGTRGDRAEYDVAGRQREVVGVVFADPEEVHADLLGMDALFDEVPDRLGMGQRAIVIVVGDIAEGVQAEDKRERRTFARGFSYGIRGHVWSLCLVALCGLGVQG